ncbi:MAG: hypothetical protein QXS42_01960 [Zestosphaera sp.]
MLEEVVINALRRLGAATYEELRNYLIREGEDFLDVELRETVARLVREGRVEKLPNPEKLKLVFTPRHAGPA